MAFVNETRNKMKKNNELEKTAQYSMRGMADKYSQLNQEFLVTSLLLFLLMQPSDLNPSDLSPATICSRYISPFSTYP